MHERVKQLRSLLDQRRSLLLLAFLLAHLVTHLPLRPADLSHKYHWRRSSGVRGGAVMPRKAVWPRNTGVRGSFLFSLSLSRLRLLRRHTREKNKQKTKTFCCQPRRTASHIYRRGKLNQSIMLFPVLHKIQLSFFYISSRVPFVKSDAHRRSRRAWALTTELVLLRIVRGARAACARPPGKEAGSQTNTIEILSRKSGLLQALKKSNIWGTRYLLGKEPYAKSGR